jgi:hypothetical protein
MAALLRPGGEVLIADCFRSAHYKGLQRSRAVGSEHALALMYSALEKYDLTLVQQEDITEAVAPSIDIEQALFNAIGKGVVRVDAELSAKKPVLRWITARFLRLVAGERRLFRLNERLCEQKRTAAAFCHYNRHMIFRLRVPQ